MAELKEIPEEVRGLAHQFGKAVDTMSAEDQVQMWYGRKEALALLLGHTASHPDN